VAVISHTSADRRGPATDPGLRQMASKLDRRFVSCEGR
jgi:hypothetical protein